MEADSCIITNIDHKKYGDDGDDIGEWDGMMAALDSELDGH